MYLVYIEEEILKFVFVFIVVAVFWAAGDRTFGLNVYWANVQPMNPSPKS